MTLALGLVLLLLVLLAIGALAPLHVDVGIEFDSTLPDWWKPNARAWSMTALRISTLYACDVGALGVHLVAAVEFLDERAGLDVDELAE
jgi:hypothetical protein